MSTPAPLVSFLIPVYNAEDYITACLESVLNQTYLNLEIIIINDCSTDRTVSIISKYKDSRIKLFDNQSNLGVVQSLNRGWGLCTGKYIARMDADDISLPNRIFNQTEFLENKLEYDILAGGIQCFGNSEEIILPPQSENELKSQILFENPIAHPTVMFRKKSFPLGPYNDQDIHMEDWGLWIHCLFIKKYRIATTSEIFLKYRTHKNNVSRKDWNNGRIARLNDFYVRIFHMLQINVSIDTTKVFVEYMHGRAFEKFGYKSVINAEKQVMNMILDTLNLNENSLNRVRKTYKDKFLFKSVDAHPAKMLLYLVSKPFAFNLWKYWIINVLKFG